MATQLKPTTAGPDDPWAGFDPGLWQREINLRAFILKHVTPYYDDEDFLAGPTARTLAIWEKLSALFVEERKKGVLDVSQIPSSITAHEPGYIDKDNEIIVGLQTDAPLKRAIMPNGGFRLVVAALDAFGYKPDPEVVETFTKHRKTHNDAVFDAYTAAVRKCRSSHILTGLPDAYGRGRIIGDYRRVALYGVDRLIEAKTVEKAQLDGKWSSDDVIRDREELAEQIRALGELKEMAAKYGFDISRPAASALEAVQWLYFGYLAGVKEQNGAAMSLGRTSTFLDIYFERDLAAGLLTEEEAQEIIDDFVIKLRIVRFLRTPEYDELFAGDPTWVTESIGGMADDGRPLVTKTSFRFLQTLYNLGPAPEPNLTIWYSPELPEAFRRFTAKVAIDTSSIQFENDAIMRGAWGDDGAIACCVSPMAVGKQMQFFGARANLAKCMLYAINGGRDEISGKQVGPELPPLAGETLEFDTVVERLETMMDWLAGTYVSAMNVIHYMHDKYAYERIEMALHDYDPLRTMAFGIAGMSVVADSMSAIRYGTVTPIRDNTGLIVDYITEGEFPKFGNNDNRVDHMAEWLVSTFMRKLRRYPTYRNALHTQSVLTITSNVVYGKATGHTPDGRRQGEPFAPGANPMHGR
ncbi:MAG TPA: pyruvate formate lyase family protein, partial [Novosphingobium sp.]